MPGPCPTAEQLAAALRGTQSSADEERLGAHLSDCPECRTRLEKMAGGSVWLQARAAKRADTTRSTSDSSDPSQRSPLLERAMQNLQRPSEASTPLNADPLLEPGTVLHQFGDYEVLEELGRGGMGVVFKSRQRSLNRMVALKLILAGQLASETEVRRFRNEAEAAARLDHPGILPVYEIGEHEGRHYFTMKLVEGQPLSSRLADLRSRKSYREMAGLVAQMARAVHFAHQHGILHRDLKPSNILLDAGDQPYLMDFGLAKILENDSNLTLTVAVMGTPNYMAPEVASGQARQVTTAVDVFSLGAILYELLTGHPPFQAATSTQTLRLVLEKDPASPVALNPAVPNDLATICLKCLEKEPARRYASAELLAQDLELFCHGEPITARPLTAVEQFGRWYRRNRLVFTAASAVVAALVIGLGVSTWMFFRERADWKRANEQTAIARAVNDFLQDDLLGQADSRAQVVEGFTPDPNLTVHQALERAAARIGNRFKDQPLEEAAVQMAIGDALRGVGEWVQAVAHLQRALELRRAILGPNHPDTLTSMSDLAIGYLRAGKLDQALRLSEETLKLRKAMLGPHHPDTLESMGEFAWTCLEAGKLDQALPLFQETLKLQKAKLGPDHPDILSTMANLAIAYEEAGKLDQALPLYEKTLKLRKAKLGPDHPETLNTMDNLGNAYEEAGKLDQALSLYEETLKLQKAKLGPDHPDTLMTMNNLAIAYEEAGKGNQALPLFEEALRLQEVKLGPDHPLARKATYNLRMAYRKAGRVAELEKLLIDRLAEVRQLAPNDPSRLTIPVNDLVEALLWEHKYAQAEQVLNDVLTAPILDKQASAGLLRSRGDLRARRGEWNTAAEDLSRVRDFNPDDHRVWHELAALLVTSDQLDAYHEQCRKSLERFGNTSDPVVAERIAKDCLILPASGADLGIVAKMADTAAAGTNRPEAPWFQLVKGLAEYRQGRFAEAVEWLDKALNKEGQQAERDVETYMVLAMAEYRLKQTDEARAALAKGAEIERTKLPKMESGDLGGNWPDWIMAHALMQEAKALLEAPSETKAAAKRTRSRTS